MNQKHTAFLGLAALAIILAGALFAYNRLQDGTAPDNFVLLDAREESQHPEVEQPREEEPLEEFMPEEIINEEPPPENNQHQQAPDFAMMDAYGNELQLSDFFGKPIVLNFWATWCPACVMETPYFENLYQELGDSVHVLKVNLLDGNRETREGVDSFMHENGYTFPLYFDISGAAMYGVRAIPVTFFICEDGYAVAMSQGAVNDSVLQQGLDAVRG